MNHRERVRAALRGEPVDRAPISLWHHFPDRDGTAEELATATIEFQRQLDLDLVKLMPTGMYPVLDYGVQARPDDIVGTTRFADGPIREPGDWACLPGVSPDRGVLAREVEVVRRVRQALGPNVPVIQTIFSPLTVADKLVAGGVRDVLEDHDNAIAAALPKLTADVIAFGRACLDAGADGFFFATQLAARSVLPDGAYERLGVPYDREVLEALRPGCWCTILHLHGADPFFDLADRYPVDGVNWHDRETLPSLAEAFGRTSRCLVAGVTRRGPILDLDADAITHEVHDAVEQTGGQRLIVAPGCVIPVSVTSDQLTAARHAVDP
jgi:uroporphyrinogen decarboxylase